MDKISRSPNFLDLWAFLCVTWRLGCWASEHPDLAPKMFTSQDRKVMLACDNFYIKNCSQETWSSARFVSYRPIRSRYPSFGDLVPVLDRHTPVEEDVAQLVAEWRQKAPTMVPEFFACPTREVQSPSRPINTGLARQQPTTPNSLKRLRSPKPGSTESSGKRVKSEGHEEQPEDETLLRPVPQDRAAHSADMFEAVQPVRQGITGARADRRTRASLPQDMENTRTKGSPAILPGEAGKEPSAAAASRPAPSSMSRSGGRENAAHGSCLSLSSAHETAVVEPGGQADAEYRIITLGMVNVQTVASIEPSDDRPVNGPSLVLQRGTAPVGSFDSQHDLGRMQVSDSIETERSPRAVTEAEPGQLDKMQQDMKRLKKKWRRAEKLKRKKMETMARQIAKLNKTLHKRKK
ncbi:hypothetical protein C8034_v003688 [Colletotrichum sidae]|uniref:Uncharacterized protein n=1 Tax=Colletotrichum sidae TaxID=1347389 RepID=A0A4R8T9X6_9PEZI|nr:hypothetical protein C8034_v003688 [Colletotrichum sidae]